MSDPDLMRDVALGMDVEAFLQTTLGRTLVERCDGLIDEARAALEDVDPEDPKAIRALQNKAAIGHQIKSWLQEFAEKGDEAERVVLAGGSTDPA